MEKNPFEQPKKSSAPDNAEQFAGEQVQERESYMNTAKGQVEGILLYAPLSSEVKQKLLDRLESIPVSSPAVNSVFNDSQNNSLSDAQKAGLVVNREMRGALSNIRNEVSKESYQMLELVLDHFYTEPSDYTNDLLAKWVNGSEGPQQDI